MGSNTDRSVCAVVCGYRHLFRYVLRLVLVLLALSLFSMLFVSRGSESYYIALVNFMLLVPMLGVTVSFVYLCGKRNERKTIDST